MTEPLFSPADLDRLAAPHVARAWFLWADLPSGEAWLHNGMGNITVAGQKWRGVADPLSGRLATLSAIEEPRFGAAAAVEIGLVAANAEFLASVHATRAAIEGRDAQLSFAVFDQETGDFLTGLKLMVRGRLTSPRIKWSGIGSRLVTITLESIWSSQNFPFGGKWNGADQRRRYPGDKGLDFVGVEVTETLK